MKRFAPLLGRVALTLVLVAGAVVGGRSLWKHYMDDPWTRDGRVRADVITITPDVSGLVAAVLVHDNEMVHAGQVLFHVDQARFALALEQADAALAEAKATYEEAQRESMRYGQLNQVAVSRQTQEQADAKAEEADAAYRRATADRAIAALNLKRTDVIAPSDGIVSNVDLQPGDYVAAGHGVMALVDTATLHVEGYFEETKLSRIAIGAPATVRLMGQSQTLHGHVESIAGGIVDRERTDGASLLANVTPTFNWVRLAQRVPVRIRLDAVPPGVMLVAGRTATVVVHKGAVAHGTGARSVAER